MSVAGSGVSRDELLGRMAEIVVAAYRFTDGPCAPTDDWHALCSLCERLADVDIAALEASE